MPITRVPVVHKFGIISQTQRVDLEKRIAKKAYLETRRKLEAQQLPEQRPLPFEVTEDFVYKFNDSGDEDRIKLEDTAMKMLKRLKRLAGLRQAGEAYYVDLPRAWVDLALLAQCRSFKLEEACLETLIASLDQAVVNEEQVLSLFYLAKSGVHWLKKDAGNQPVLRSNEILLLKMTRLVFTRLYCHHQLDQLKDFEDQRTSLGQYLRGFSEKATSFNQFPGAYLSFRFISEAGRVICVPTQRSADEEIENKSHAVATTPHNRTSREDESLENTLHTETHRDDVEDKKDDMHANNSVKPIVFPSTDTDFSVFLRCTLNVWCAVNQDANSLNDALYDLLQSATHLSEEQWLDLVLAFHILADACRSSVRVVEAFQYLMSLEFSPVVIQVDRAPHLCDTCYSSLPTSPDKKANISTSFRDSLPKNESLAGNDKNATSNLVKTLQEFVGLDFSPDKDALEDMTFDRTKDSTTYSSRPQKYVQERNIPVDSYSVASRPPQRRYPRHPWPWELVYTFCECLATVCIHGTCSDAQKYSLLGTSSSAFKRHKSGMKSRCGLMEFLQYDDGHNSWKVRYGAVKSLVLVCRYYDNDITKDGVTNVGRSSLMECQSTESEPRVLEAMKIAKVEADLEKKLNKDHVPTSLWASRLASALTDVLYYNVIPTRTHTPADAAAAWPDKPENKKTSVQIPVPSHSEICKKPTIRQQINLSNASREPRPDYNTRQNLELRAVVEVQWKKQLLEEIENEIHISIEQLDKEREHELKRTTNTKDKERSDICKESLS